MPRLGAAAPGGSHARRLRAVARASIQPPLQLRDGPLLASAAPYQARIWRPSATAPRRPPRGPRRRSLPPQPAPHWERRSDLAPLWRSQLAPPPSDLQPTVRCSWSWSGRRRKEWDGVWRRSSRSGGTGIGRACRSGRWRSAMVFIAARCVRRWPRRSAPVKRTPVGRPAPKLGGYQELIDSSASSDRDAPRKQRHTARRIWERLRDEHAADVAERPRYVVLNTFIGLGGSAGRACRRSCRRFMRQVWRARSTGVRRRSGWPRPRRGSTCSTCVLATRVRRSRWRSPHCSQQAFLEAHVQAFDLVRRGVRPGALRQSRERCQAGTSRPPACADRPVHRAALALSLRVAASFTIPGVEGAHEKGGVEGEVGRFRRRHLVPVRRSRRSLLSLNARLLAGCNFLTGGSPGARRPLVRRSRGSARCCAGCRPRRHPRRSRLPQG